MRLITIVELLITALAVICLVIVLMGFRKALRLSTIPVRQHQRLLIFTTLFLLLWMVIIGVLAYAQVFAAPGLPPRPMFTVVAGLIIMATLSFTQTGKLLLSVTPLHWLVFFQAFRIGVELWFWYAYKAEVLPQIMTFEGANLDIFAGLLAVLAGLFIMKWPKYAKPIALTFNIAGILLLVNTLRAAALSMPSAIQRYPFDERLLLLGQPFFIYLPSVLVVLALGFHILSLRQIALLGNAGRYKRAVVV